MSLAVQEATLGEGLSSPNSQQGRQSSLSLEQESTVAVEEMCASMNAADGPFVATPPPEMDGVSEPTLPGAIHDDGDDNALELDSLTTTPVHEAVQPPPPGGVSPGGMPSNDNSAGMQALATPPHTPTEEEETARDTQNMLDGRMVGVPPKDPKEAAQHKKQMKKLREAEQKRMKEEARRLAAERKRLEKAEKAWIKDILPHFDTMRPNAKKLFFEGVPPSVRPLVWRAAIGNRRGVTPDEYERCVQAAADRQNRSALESIDMDISAQSTEQELSAVAANVPVDRTPARNPLNNNTGSFTAVSAQKAAAGVRHHPSTQGARRAAAAHTAIDEDVNRTHIINQTPTDNRATPSLPLGNSTSSPVADEATRRASVQRHLLQEATTAAAAAGAATEEDGALMKSPYSDWGTGAGPEASDELVAAVRTLLRGYAELEPDVGYVQGMSYVAAMLLYELPPFDAFCAFANLMSQGHFNFFYTVNQRAMNAHVAVYEDALEIASPKLAKTLKEHHVDAELYLIEWWMTLFSRTMPLPVARRCWDMYLGDSAMLYRISLAIVLSAEETLLASPSEALVYLTTLHRCPDELDHRHVMQLATAAKPLPSLQWLTQVANAKLQPWSYNTEFQKTGAGRSTTAAA